MNFICALNIEGTKKYQVLTYHYVRLNAAEEIINKIRISDNDKISNSILLCDDDWPLGVILVEHTFSDPDHFESVILNACFESITSNEIIGSLCIFDGVFCGYREVLGPSFCKDIYMIYIKGAELNLATSQRIRDSNAWADLITEFRATIDGELSSKN